MAAKTLFVRHARTLCTECRTPTRYTHVLLGCRLCEACERAFPHKFGLVTQLQLIYEVNSSFDQLKPSQRTAVFRQLPCFRQASSTWYLRAQATAAAAEQLNCHDDAISDEDLDAAPTASSPRPSLAKAAEPRETCKAVLKEAQKAHKRQVKLANRLKRESGGQPAPANVPPAALHYKPKRAPVSKHRQLPSEPNAWEIEYRDLEARLGSDLSGLSGLVLARECKDICKDG